MKVQSIKPHPKEINELFQNMREDNNDKQISFQGSQESTKDAAYSTISSTQEKELSLQAKMYDIDLEINIIKVGRKLGGLEIMLSILTSLKSELVARANSSNIRS